MRLLFVLFIVFLIDLGIYGQVKSAKLVADGLTCSMCSKSVHKAIMTIDYVDSVTAHLESASFDIYFKQKISDLDLNKIVSKVEGAGFSVGQLKLRVNFNSIQVANGSRIYIENKLFQFINVKEQSLNEVKDVKLLNKGFISKKEYKSNSRNAIFKCVYKPEIDDCKFTNGSKTDYYITIE